MFAIASEFLARSRPAPVRIKIMTSGPACASTIDSWIVEKLSKESSRLEKFDANIGVDGITYETLYFPAPKLKALHIWSNNSEFPVLPPIFNSYFPNLQNLKLGSFSSLPAGRFTNLTSLILGWYGSYRKMSGIEILDVLQASPTLKFLNMRYHGPVGEDVCRGRLIHLPCLQALDLDGCNFEFILTHVVFSQTRRVFLHDHLHYKKMLPGFEVGAQHVLSGIPQEFLHQLVSNGIDGLSLNVKYRGNELDVEVRHSQLILKITQHLGYDEMRDDSFVRRSLNCIVNTQPLASICLLIICGDELDVDKDIFSEELWDSWFSRLDRLEFLDLQRVPIKDCCMALMKENTEGNLPFAQLKILDFEIYEPSIEDLDLISEMVMGRHSKGLILNQIGIVGINSELEQEATKGWENLCNQYAKIAHFQSLIGMYDVVP
jgi:hypothetical protein